MQTNKVESLEKLGRLSMILEPYVKESKDRIEIIRQIYFYFDVKRNNNIYYEYEKKENKKYDIPHMCITKEDLLAHFEGKDNYEELKKEINELDDVDMQTIADEMTDFMMSSYWLALEEAFCKVVVEK